jgi:hypothetical protein
MQPNHPAPGDLQEFCFGKPSPELDSRVHAHIEECEECLRQVCEMMRRKKRKTDQRAINTDSPRAVGK